jgi:hypothetical protein
VATTGRKSPPPHLRVLLGRAGRRWGRSATFSRRLGSTAAAFAAATQCLLEQVQASAAEVDDLVEDFFECGYGIHAVSL